MIFTKEKSTLIFHDHFIRVMAEILLAPEPNYKLKY